MKSGQHGDMPPPARRLPLLLVVLVLLGSAWGCESPSSSPDAQGPQGQASPSAASAASAPSAPSRAVTKLLVVVEENHSLTQMRSEMPYTFALAKRFGYATRYYALTHPSLPNYLAIASGQTHGVTDDEPPSAHALPGQTVFGQALAAGKTAAVYAEGMTGTCATESQGRYAARHNPWAYFVDERAGCDAHDVPMTTFRDDVQQGRLPDVGMVVPDTCNDAHDCDLSVADDWVRNLMSRVFDGPDWKSGHLAVVVTADEDDHSEDNKVLTVVVHPSQAHHVVSRRLDHYALTRLYEDVAGVSHLANARTAASMADAFGLPLS